MDKITLEPVTLRYAEEIQRLASHPLIVETTALPSPYPEEGARSWIEQVLEPRRNAGQEYAYAIIREDGTFLGVCGFNNIPVDKARVEIGYWIGVPYWGHGYATEACRHAVDLAFTTMEFQSLYAPILARNRASQRVLEKLGFRHMRTYTNTMYAKWSKYEILVEFSLTRHEWMTTATGSQRP